MADLVRAADLHTSKRMHFIEEPSTRTGRATIRTLHTSKRMHFIEELFAGRKKYYKNGLHTSKRMHFIEDGVYATDIHKLNSCIRQNVCTSLRSRACGTVEQGACNLHTSKRMHFIEEW